ncbi:MAG TPA: hypothetical protein PLP90_06775 [Methanoculleus sp.]|nr:hypothetical protein [Methanoculleus sp.]
MIRQFMMSRQFVPRNLVGVTASGSRRGYPGATAALFHDLPPDRRRDEYS